MQLNQPLSAGTCLPYANGLYVGLLGVGGGSGASVAAASLGLVVAVIASLLML